MWVSFSKHVLPVHNHKLTREGYTVPVLTPSPLCGSKMSNNKITGIWNKILWSPRNVQSWRSKKSIHLSLQIQKLVYKRIRVHHVAYFLQNVQSRHSKIRNHLFSLQFQKASKCTIYHTINIFILDIWKKMR